MPRNRSRFIRLFGAIAVPRREAEVAKHSLREVRPAQRELSFVRNGSPWLETVDDADDTRVTVGVAMDLNCVGLLCDRTNFSSRCSRFSLHWLTIQRGLGT